MSYSGNRHYQFGIHCSNINISLHKVIFFNPIIPYLKKDYNRPFYNQPLLNRRILNILHHIIPCLEYI